MLTANRSLSLVLVRWGPLSGSGKNITHTHTHFTLNQPRPGAPCNFSNWGFKRIIRKDNNRLKKQLFNCSAKDGVRFKSFETHDCIKDIIAWAPEHFLKPLLVNTVSWKLLYSVLIYVLHLQLLGIRVVWGQLQFPLQHWKNIKYQWQTVKTQTFIIFR